MCGVLAALSLAHSNPPLTMPPKVKTALAPEPMPTQPDSSELDTQSVTETEKPPKKKKKSAKAKGKTKNKSREGQPSKVTLVKNAIAKRMLVHPEKVQQFMEALDTVAVDFLNTNKVFRLNFLTVRLHTMPAHEAGPKRVFGEDVVLKELPERRTLGFTPSNSLTKQLCK